MPQGSIFALRPLPTSIRGWGGGKLPDAKGKIDMQALVANGNGKADGVYAGCKFLGENILEKMGIHFEFFVFIFL